MKLHDDCKKRLLEELIKYLPEITASNNMFLDYNSTYNLRDIDKILPSKSEFRDLIDERPFYVFIIEELRRQLSKLQYKNEEKEKKIIDLLSDGNIEKFAEKLISDFEMLPYEYKLFIKLSDNFKELLSFYDNQLTINNDLKIILLNDGYIKNNNIQTITKEKENNDGIISSKWLVAFSDPNSLEKDSIYLELSTKGYVGITYPTETILQSYDFTKYLFGLGLAHYLFKFAPKYRSDKNDTVKVFCKIGDNWTFDSFHNLPDDLKGSIQDIDVVSDFLGPEKKMSKKDYDFPIYIIGKLLSNPLISQKILIASKWFYEGISGTNELLSFIQNTVVLEILLGDKLKSDIIGISELLRNRCAYLISKSDDERQKILKEFNEIYDIRSQIVHRGKSKLNENENTLLYKLRALCARVITKEISLLKL